MQVTIYIPKPNSAASRHILPGSAVVGQPAPSADGMVLCYFEGAQYGQSGMRAFADRLMYAAGRWRDRYPTVAMGGFSSEDLTEVGTYDADRFIVTAISDAAALTAWSGEPLDAIIGVRVPTGDVAVSNVAPLVQPDAGGQQIAQDGRAAIYWFRTRAGQVIAFDGLRRSATAYEHDDPALEAALDGILPDAKRRLVFGKIVHESPKP